jgi:hypothetical protein
VKARVCSFDLAKELVIFRPLPQHHLLGAQLHPVAMRDRPRELVEEPGDQRNEVREMVPAFAGCVAIWTP